MLPLAVTIFVFILISNWLSVLPVQYTDEHGQTTELLKPAAADINYVLALALFVFVCYHAAGIWRRGIAPPQSSCSRARGKSWRRSTSSKNRQPISLSLRLFGNIFAAAFWSRSSRSSRPTSCGAECDLEVLRLVRRRDSGLHFRAADDLVLQPSDGARRGSPLKLRETA
ncbi:ATP synthase A chain family protein [Mycobacterium ulcerans str. Harvey]|uniref:ATP synthase A chain family protein n=1 Tax=Mycobacterium ulcerans str. Harvey TaxID=1299332 RepID=A0ABN0R9I1_MYCUL|nr:ATP synthase A chain family protein [Mycobacterium ulcerans str. Harvey]